MHWVPDLEDAIARCTELGFPPQRGGRIGDHLHNGVWLGRKLEYVELISVVDLEPWRHGPRGPVAASREAAMLAGGGALQFAFEVDDVGAVVADVRRRGVVMRDPAAGSIRYPSDNTAAWETAWVDEGPPGGRSSSDTRRRAATVSQSAGAAAAAAGLVVPRRCARDAGPAGCGRLACPAAVRRKHAGRRRASSGRVRLRRAVYVRACRPHHPDPARWDPRASRGCVRRALRARG
jgi:hypothetical protein